MSLTLYLYLSDVSKYFISAKPSSRYSIFKAITELSGMARTSAMYKDMFDYDVTTCFNSLRIPLRRINREKTITLVTHDDIKEYSNNVLPDGVSNLLIAVRLYKNWGLGAPRPLKI